MELKMLTALNGVSGNEDCVRDAIMDHVKAHCDDVKVDRMGNVIAYQKGTGSGEHVMLVAHMDEVGLIVRGIKDDGLIVYETVGGLDPRIMVSKRVRVGNDAIPGVIGCKAIHLQTQEERAKPLTHKQLYVDIGTKDKAVTEKLVALGDYIAFESEYVEFGDGLVKAKALDDRVGCYNLLRLMQSRYPGDVTYAFTVQEEVGLRGAYVAARQSDADIALVLESTTANDLGDVSDHFKVCRVGRGVVISFMDNASIAHPDVNRKLRTLGEQKGIAWQPKTYIAGGNDAGAIQTARGSVAVCTLSIPCRNIHSPANVCSLSDVDAQYQLVEAFLNAPDDQA